MRGVALLLVVFLAACEPEPNSPEIGRNLPADFADGQRVFDGRLKARYPVGSDEQELVDELVRQGFEKRLLDSYDGFRSAEFTSNGFVSQTFWSVRWRAKGGKVTDIWGIYGSRSP